MKTKNDIPQEVVKKGIEGFINGAKDEEMNKNNNINANVNNDVNVNVNTNENVIVIVKHDEEEKTKLFGYHLPISMGKKVEKLAKKSNMSNSQFIKRLLEETLDKIIIED